VPVPGFPVSPIFPCIRILCQQLNGVLHLHRPRIIPLIRHLPVDVHLLLTKPDVRCLAGRLCSGECGPVGEFLVLADLIQCPAKARRIIYLRWKLRPQNLLSGHAILRRQSPLSRLTGVVESHAWPGRRSRKLGKGTFLVYDRPTRRLGAPSLMRRRYAAIPAIDHLQIRVYCRDCSRRARALAGDFDGFSPN
jgi:hypothetical protein